MTEDLPISVGVWTAWHIARIDPVSWHVGTGHVVTVLGRWLLLGAVITPTLPPRMAWPRTRLRPRPP